MPWKGTVAAAPVRSSGKGLVNPVRYLKVPQWGRSREEGRGGDGTDWRVLLIVDVGCRKRTQALTFCFKMNVTVQQSLAVFLS